MLTSYISNKRSTVISRFNLYTHRLLNFGDVGCARLPPTQQSKSNGYKNHLNGKNHFDTLDIWVNNH